MSFTVDKKSYNVFEFCLQIHRGTKSRESLLFHLKNVFETNWIN